MTLAGSMTISIYDSEIRNIYHDLGYWIINLCYWYPDTKYTREQAIEAFKNKDKQPKRSEMTVHRIRPPGADDGRAESKENNEIRLLYRPDRESRKPPEAGEAPAPDRE